MEQVNRTGRRLDPFLLTLRFLCLLRRFPLLSLTSFSPRPGEPWAEGHWGAGSAALAGSLGHLAILCVAGGLPCKVTVFKQLENLSLLYVLQEVAQLG